MTMKKFTNFTTQFVDLNTDREFEPRTYQFATADEMRKAAFQKRDMFASLKSFHSTEYVGKVCRVYFNDGTMCRIWPH